MKKTQQRRFRLRWSLVRGEAGFGFAELVVAMGVGALIASAAAAVVSTSLRSVALSRMRSVATVEAEAVAETARSIPYNNLGLVSSDSTVSTDPKITNVGGILKFDNEAVAFSPNFSGHPFNPHIATFARGSFQLTRSIWITSADTNADGTADSRRITISVTWNPSATAPNSSVQLSTLISEAGSFGAGAPGCPPGATSCVVGTVPISAESSASTGSMSIKADTGNLSTRLGAVLESNPPTELHLPTVGGSTIRRAISRVSCLAESPWIMANQTPIGQTNIQASADDDPSSASPLSEEQSTSASPVLPGGPLTDSLSMVQASSGSALSCLADALNAPGDGSPAPDDSLPYESGTSESVGAVTLRTLLPGAGLSGGDYIDVVTASPSRATQTINHSASFSERQTSSVAESVSGDTRLLRVPGLIENGVATIKSFSTQAATYANEQTLPAAPSAGGGTISLRLLDPSSSLSGCTTRVGNECWVDVNPNLGARSFSTTGEVVSLFTKITYGYAVSVLGPTATTSTNPATGAKLYDAAQTAVTYTAWMKVEVTVDVLLGTKVLLSDVEISGTAGGVSSKSCSGVGCA